MTDAFKHSKVKRTFLQFQFELT